MGSFSVQFAQRPENYARRNVSGDLPFRLLIPKEFGGGSIVDLSYDDYGRITDNATGKTYDWYDLVAFFNMDHLDYWHNNCSKLMENIGKETTNRFKELEWSESEKALIVKNDYIESVLAQWLKKHPIQDPDSFRYITNLLRNDPKELAEKFIQQLDSFDESWYLYSGVSGSLAYSKFVTLSDSLSEKDINALRTLKHTNMLPDENAFSKLRYFGIQLACYDKQHSCLRYPLKIVPVELDITYEECTGFSKSDRNQGGVDIDYDHFPELEPLGDLFIDKEDLERDEFDEYIDWYMDFCKQYDLDKDELWAIWNKYKHAFIK